MPRPPPPPLPRGAVQRAAGSEVRRAGAQAPGEGRSQLVPPRAAPPELALRQAPPAPPAVPQQLLEERAPSQAPMIESAAPGRQLDLRPRQERRAAEATGEEGRSLAQRVAVAEVGPLRELAQAARPP